MVMDGCKRDACICTYTDITLGKLHLGYSQKIRGNFQRRLSSTLWDYPRENIEELNSEHCH